MFIYQNLNCNSNITHYTLGNNYITVIFQLGEYKKYTYTYKSAGKSKVEDMKRLAEQGSGLNSFIDSNCQELYDFRI